MSSVATSHLLPPIPLEPEDEWCCAGAHFRKDDPRALSECPQVRAPLRERRAAEQAAFREGVRGFALGVVVRRDHLSEFTAWGFSASASIGGKS